MKQFLQILVVIYFYVYHLFLSIQRKISEGCSADSNGYFWLVGCCIFFNLYFSALLEFFIMRIIFTKTFFRSSFNVDNAMSSCCQRLFTLSTYEIKEIWEHSVSVEKSQVIILQINNAIHKTVRYCTVLPGN